MGGVEELFFRYLTFLRALSQFGDFMRISWLLVISISISLISLPVRATESPDYLEQWLSMAGENRFAGEPVTLKFAHPAPPASLLPPVFQQVFDSIASKTRGALTVTQFGGGSLYGEKGGFKAIRAGVADFGLCYSNHEKNGFELTQMLNVPLAAPTDPFVKARIMAEIAPRYMSPEFEKRGVYLGFLIPFKPLSLMSKTAIRRPADLKGKKVVSFVNTPGFEESAGFVKISIPFPEIYTALQQGLIDAVIWSDMGFIPFKIYEQAKFYTEINAASFSLESCINPKRFKTLSKAMRKTLYDAQQVITAAVLQKSEQFHKQANSIYQEQGVEILQLSTEEQAAWQASYNPLLNRWLKHCDEAGKDCRGMSAEIQRLAEHYKNTSHAELIQLMLNKPVPGIIDFSQ